MRTLFFKGLRFLQQCKTDFYFLGKKKFPYGEDPNKCTYFAGFFPYRDSIDQGQSYGARYFHLGFLGVYLSHVGAIWPWYPSALYPCTQNPSIMEDHPSTIGDHSSCDLSVQYLNSSSCFLSFINLVPSPMASLFEQVRQP